MKCIIIEDQAPAQHILQKYIGSTDRLQLEATFCDAIEAGSYLKEHAVDVIFLDIDLPRKSGLDFLRSVADPPLTILTTAFTEFAVESYQLNVVDYLLKPFSLERFTQAVEKAVKMDWVSRHVKQMQGAMSAEDLYIKTGHAHMKVSKQEIIFIKSDSNYTEVITPSIKYLTSDALRDWIAKLDHGFLQVHKSYIVNTTYLKKVSGNKIILSTNQVVPLGRAFKKHFMESVVKPQQ